VAAKQGTHLRRSAPGLLIPIISLGSTFIVYKVLEAAFAAEGVGAVGTTLVAGGLGLVGAIWGWWLRTRRIEDAAWMTRLSVFLVDHYPVDREDAALTFARPFAIRWPWQPYRFGTHHGARRNDARYLVTVSKKGVVTVAQNWARKDPATGTTTRRFTAVTRLPQTPPVGAGPAHPSSAPAVTIPAPTPPSALGSPILVALSPQPKLARRSGRSNQLATIAIVLALLTFFAIEAFTERPFLTSFAGATAAFLLALLAALAAFGTTDDLKATARWRMVAAAELTAAASTLSFSLTFAEAVALMHSDRDSRSQLLQELTLGRFMGDHFTCVLGARRLTLSPEGADWSLKVEPA